MSYKRLKAVSVIFSLTIILVESDSTINLTDDEPQAVWEPTSNDQLTVNADEGYTIAVNITDCDMDGSKGDFVKISNVVDAIYADDYTELMFTYSCMRNLSYFYENNQISAQYKATNESSMFRAIFTRVEDQMVSTTTEIPSSTVYLPTPSNIVQAEITVYLYGARPEIFTNTSQALYSLKQVISEMAIKYTTINNFPLNGSISESNVIIQNLEQCHVNWEDSDTCTKLTFSIPINLLKSDAENPRWDGYQLDQNHLQLLWDTYASTYIPKTGLQLYPVPNIDGIFKLRLLVTVSIVVVFAVVMLVTLRIVLKRINNKRKSILSDQISIIDNNSTRPSEISMTEHYLQETPPWQNEAPVFPSQGFHNLSFEPDNQFEEFENLSPTGKNQRSAFDLVNLDNSDGEEHA